MSLARVIVAFLLLLLPHIAAAAPTGFGFYSDAYYGVLDLDEHQGGVATWFNDYEGYVSPYCSYNDDCLQGYAYYDRLWASGGDFAILRGEAEFTSGPFISETDLGHEAFDSRFAAGGILTFTFNVVPLSDDATGPWPQVVVGPMQTIEFRGELGAFEVRYALPPLDTSHGECCGGGYTRIPITSWSMSREDADVLGLNRRRGGGGVDRWGSPISSLHFDMDYNDRPTDPDRHELRTYDQFGAVTAVPEPGIAALVLVGLGASLRRWRRGKRAGGRISTTDRTGSPID